MAYSGGYADGYAEAAQTDPTLAVEVEWVAGTWTDETTRVRSWDTTRGRMFELDRYQAGRATVVFDNTDRRFDPAYSAGALYGNLEPNRRMRLRATWAGVTRDLFTGYIDRLAQEYVPPSEATAVVTATDAFKRLARAELPASVWAAEIADEAPTWWFPFDEAAGETTVYSRTSWGLVGTLRWTTAAPALGAPGLVTRGGGSAVTFIDEASYITVADPAGLDVGVTTAAPFTIEFLIDCAATSATIGQIWRQPFTSATTEGHISVYLEGGTPTNLAFTISTNPAGGGLVTSATARTTTAVDLADGNTHHVAVTFSAGTMRIYVDGVDRTASATSYSGATVPRVKQFYVGGEPGSTVGVGRFDATLDELVVYGASVLSATQISEHYGAMKVGGQWAGDTTGGRVGRILDEIGYSGRRAVDTGGSTLLPATLGGTALAYLHRVEETEAGGLYVAADGTVTFKTRSSTWNPPLAWTFSDDGADLGYTDLAYDRDDARIVNDAVVSREGGSPQRVTDQDSVDVHGRISRPSEGLLFTTDLEAWDRANYVVNVYKDPQDRVERLAVNPYAEPATLFPAVLDVDLGTRIRVERTPQAVGAQISGDYVVESVRHRGRPKQWVAEWSTSPAGQYDFLQLDDTDGGGLGNVRLAY